MKFKRLVALQSMERERQENQSSISIRGDSLLLDMSPGHAMTRTPVQHLLGLIRTKMLWSHRLWSKCTALRLAGGCVMFASILRLFLRTSTLLCTLACMDLSRSFESRDREFSNRIFVSTTANLVYDEEKASASGESAAAQLLSTSRRARKNGAASSPPTGSSALERKRRANVII